MVSSNEQGMGTTNDAAATNFANNPTPERCAILRHLVAVGDAFAPDVYAVFNQLDVGPDIQLQGAVRALGVPR
eukprot:11231716-Alexandrium_andersonii.AAC.1